MKVLLAALVTLGAVAQAYECGEQRGFGFFGASANDCWNWGSCADDVTQDALDLFVNYDYPYHDRRLEEEPSQRHLMNKCYICEDEAYMCKFNPPKCPDRRLQGEEELQDLEAEFKLKKRPVLRHLNGQAAKQRDAMLNDPCWTLLTNESDKFKEALNNIIADKFSRDATQQRYNVHPVR